MPQIDDRFAEHTAVMAGWEPTAPLDATYYARGHHLFEARSDQRSTLVDWLDAHLAETVATRPLRVLSIGCGDGSVDAALAGALAEHRPAESLSWTGVEPHGPSAEAFQRRVRATGARTTVLAGPFPAATDPLAAAGERFDVVTFVHSLYYVPDVSASVRAAVELLAPGGTLLVLHAPRGALNQVAAALAPEVGGHPQWWDETVRAALADEPGLVVTEEPLHAQVDLTGCETQDPAVLDFAVQARLTGDRRAEVRRLLASVSVVADRLVLPHPVLAFTARRHRSTPVDPAHSAPCAVAAPLHPRTVRPARGEVGPDVSAHSATDAQHAPDGRSVEE